MLTFQDQYEMAQKITGDYDTGVLEIFKRDINEGGAMFLNQLGRKFNTEFKTTDIIGGRQYYQTPSDVLRVSGIRVLQGTVWCTPELITSEEEWNDINATVVSSNYPLYFYIRGFNEIGLFPVPSSDVENGLSISFEPQHVELFSDDFSAGTITVENGSVDVSHSATGFTPQMTGRYMQITDGTDGKWYRIAAVISTSALELENYFEGISGSGRSFRIGEVMKIPQAYQDAPVYYALDRYYLTQGDKQTAADFGFRFTQKVKSAKRTYGRSTSQQGSRRSPSRRRNPRWIDLMAPIQYP